MDVKSAVAVLKAVRELNEPMKVKGGYSFSVNGFTPGVSQVYNNSRIHNFWGESTGIQHDKFKKTVNDLVSAGYLFEVYIAKMNKKVLFISKTGSEWLDGKQDEMFNRMIGVIRK